MALEKVSQEEPGVELPNPKEVAENVEHALFKLYGEILFSELQISKHSGNSIILSI